ncbi:MAG: hypothetical protein HDT02_03620 [Bacteroidales bacterium]|nr:hypothetical protein [Bacteroidales bacterium]
MLFNDIPSFVTRCDIPVIEIPAVDNMPAVAFFEIYINGRLFEPVVFRPASGLKLYNLADIVASEASGATARVVLSVPKMNLSKAFVLAFRDTFPAGFDFGKNFMTTTPLLIVPVNTGFSISATGADVAALAQADLADFINIPQQLRPTPSLSYGTLNVNLWSPAKPGSYVCKAGDRNLDLLVIPRNPDVHSLSFTNIFGVNEAIFLRCALSFVAGRDSQTALVAGQRREYDIRPKNSIKLSAEDILRPTAFVLASLGLCRDFTLDGISATLSSIDFPFDYNNQNLPKLSLELQSSDPAFCLLAEHEDSLFAL